MSAYLLKKSSYFLATAFVLNQPQRSNYKLIIVNILLISSTWKSLSKEGNTHMCSIEKARLFYFLNLFTGLVKQGMLN